MTTTPLLLLLAAAGANGLLAGASLDQSIKQLPARHRIGVLAFARYSQAADLANGVAWYATLCSLRSPSRSPPEHQSTSSISHQANGQNPQRPTARTPNRGPDQPHEGRLKRWPAATPAA